MSPGTSVLTAQWVPLFLCLGEPERSGSPFLYIQAVSAGRHGRAVSGLPGRLQGTGLARGLRAAGHATPEVL
jgi:hypothetical protein